MINKNYLKKIFIFLTTHLFFFYGKIQKIIKSNEDKRIKIKEIIYDQEFKYNIFTILTGRLYTDTVHDTAVILDNSIIKGPSFQLRDNINSICSDNIVFKRGTPRFKKKFNGTVLSLLTGGGGNENYWHWLFDVLPRLELIKTIYKKNEIDFFLFPDIKKDFQKQTLDILQIDKKKRLSSKKIRHLKTDKLIITDRPTISIKNTINDSWREEVPIWIIKYLRKNFLKFKLSKDDNFPKKIFIDRSDAKEHHNKFRSIKNENEILDYLKSVGFKSLRIGDFNFIDQIKLFSEAKEIVGLHGGGFANLVFCEPNTKVVELKNETTGNIIGDLAKKNKLNYNYVIGKNQNVQKHSQQGNIEISINDLKNKLN
jgi:capsular polysaccharide biosynthesis protein